MSKIIIGKNWEEINAKDKNEFIKVFAEFTVTNYFTRSSKFKELSFTHKETKVISNHFSYVKFRLKADKDLIYFNYVMSLNKQKWKNFDVLLD